VSVVYIDAASLLGTSIVLKGEDIEAAVSAASELEEVIVLLVVVAGSTVVVTMQG
jgi:hypothetical protein